MNEIVQCLMVQILDHQMVGWWWWRWICENCLLNRIFLWEMGQVGSRNYMYTVYGKLRNSFRICHATTAAGGSPKQLKTNHILASYAVAFITATNEWNESRPECCTLQLLQVVCGMYRKVISNILKTVPEKLDRSVLFNFFMILICISSIYKRADLFFHYLS